MTTVMNYITHSVAYAMTAYSSREYVLKRIENHASTLLVKYIPHDILSSLFLSITKIMSETVLKTMNSLYSQNLCFVWRCALLILHNRVIFIR